ncbi:uncharacterized protein LOC127100549 [Lathyrus oleraceus]|uniref:uncharacterized protein LOC127100549 n=1 Tax=Pisum sativum TaxID=3888 RepID=UPI0021D139E6|nr:uncharacterized protein LOC127100549 [Pisum sativum]
MARNGMGATSQRLLYISPLAEFILQTEAPGGMKVPKYTKFGGESELSSIKRRFAESIDDYLNRFKSLKAMCFTQVPEHELVQMAARGLDYSIRKKIDPTFVKSMSQLADRVRHLERLRLEKVRHNKAKKEKVMFVDYDATDPIYEADYASSTELEIDVAELKPGSAYECQSLLPTQGKIPIENNPKFPSKTYTFDMTKCEEIFDLCGVVTDKVVAENFQKLQLGKSKRSGLNRERQNERVPKKAVESAQARPRSFVPPKSVPRGTWVKPQGKQETPQGVAAAR